MLPPSSVSDADVSSLAEEWTEKVEAWAYLQPVLEALGKEPEDGFEGLLRSKYWSIVRKVVNERKDLKSLSFAKEVTKEVNPEVSCDTGATELQIEQRKSLASKLNGSHAKVVHERVVQSGSNLSLSFCFMCKQRCRRIPHSSS